MAKRGVEEMFCHPIEAARKSKQSKAKKSFCELC